MAEYIKRSDAMKVCQDYSSHCFTTNDASGQDIADRIENDIVEIPTADVVEVKHGHWVKHSPDVAAMRAFHKLGIGKGMSENSIFWTCSCCDSWGSLTQKYCNQCGAKMDDKV